MCACFATWSGLGSCLHWNSSPLPFLPSLLRLLLAPWAPLPTPSSPTTFALCRCDFALPGPVCARVLSLSSPCLLSCVLLPLTSFAPPPFLLAASPSLLSGASSPPEVLFRVCSHSTGSACAFSPSCASVPGTRGAHLSSSSPTSSSCLPVPARSSPRFRPHQLPPSLSFVVVCPRRVFGFSCLVFPPSSSSPLLSVEPLPCFSFAASRQFYFLCLSSRRVFVTHEWACVCVCLSLYICGRGEAASRIPS